MTISPILTRIIQPGVVASLCLLLIGVNAYPQPSTKGSCKGKIVDARTNEALPNVNVAIKGTYYGAVTDLDGNFTIANINPGQYTIAVSLLGYKAVEYTGYTIKAGETAQLDVKLEETVLSLGQEVVIVGEKPLFNIEETQSRRSINREDIKAAAVQSVKDVVAMQTGVVQADNEIHIRGGRTYENAYLLDGVSVQDPLAGTGFGLQLSPSAIQEVEVITGGYNAEYGQATSGIVNITTREGAQNYNGSLSYKRDHFGFNKNSRSNFNTDIIEASLSGPEPFTSYILPSLGAKIPGSLSFFGTFYANFTDDFTRWAETINNGQVVGYHVAVPNQVYSSLYKDGKFLSLLGGNIFLTPRENNSWSWLGKLTWKPDATLKISYSYTTSIGINQNSQTIQSTLEFVEPNPGYQFQFQNILDSANTFTQRNIQHSISITQTLSSKTFYELKLSRYTARVHGDANGKNYTDYIEPKDIVKLPLSYYYYDRDNKLDSIGVIPGDGLYDIGNPTRWRDHYFLEYSFKGDLTSNFTEKNKFKTGFEARFQSLQMIDLVSPWYRPLGLNYDIYQVNPAQGALYAQNNITLKGMILNVGLRLDYWFPGAYVDTTLAKPADSINIPQQIKQNYFDDTFSLFGHRWKARLSPRLGISHPVSDNQSLFFSYGHFSKLPNPQYVYSKLSKTSAKSTFQTIGNPDLNPETTVSYELGLRNQLSESDVLTITTYYKDIFDYITSASVKILNSRFSGGTYTTYVNQDYSRIRGIEVEYKTRLGEWLRSTISGSYSVSTGKSSSADETLYNLQQGLGENIREQPLSFSRPLQLSVDINLTAKKDHPFFGIGKGILDDYNLYTRIFYESGKRYTRQIFLGYDPTSGRPEYVPDYLHPNTEIADPWFYVNLNFEKYFNLGVGKLVLSLEIKNLFNRQNSQIINPVTGRAYQYGDPTQYPSPVVNDPLYPDLSYPVDPFPYNAARYLNPRTFLFGTEFRF